MGDGRDGESCYAHDDLLCAVRVRAMMLSASTARVMISAPVQASFASPRRGERELEDDDRQAGDRRVHVRAPELVVERGEQERRGLAADAGDRQQDAGDDAGARGAIGDLRGS